MTLTNSRVLRNGVVMPVPGLGVAYTSDEDAEKAVLWALEAGCRHVDTAKIYANEGGVGRAIAASGIPREDIFVTTKLWNDDMRNNRQREAFEQSLKDLGLDYVDLYLIHWPVGNFVESWKIMEDILASKRTRAIGVSNFQIHHLKELWRASGEIPAVNQIESHPLLTQYPLLEYCAEKDIACQAWSPLGGEGGAVLKEEAVVSVAAKHGKSPAQVVLRWDLQRGIVPLPRSTRKERIISNLDIFDFELDDADMAAIDALDRGHRFGPDPDNFSL